MNRRNKKHRRGVILLIALGMLALFSILTVTYLVFSSQSRQAAVSMHQRQVERQRPNDLVPHALRALVSGTLDRDNAVFGHDLLGDLYGVDSVRMRVGQQRITNPPTAPAVAAVMRGTLLQPTSGAPSYAPQSTFFKFPTNFVSWNADSTLEDGYDDGVYAVEPLTGHPEAKYDDTYTGRIVTFVEGPLRDQSFRIVRSFGAGNYPFPGNVVNPDENFALAYNLVVDLAEASSSTVQLATANFGLWEAADLAPNALLYDPGPDGKYGRANVDDNGNGAVDEAAEAGWPGSDDFGFQFVINGQPFNGLGTNQSGAAGVKSRDGAYTDLTAFKELQPNFRRHGEEPGQTDEFYDAADFENMFLAWQPSTVATTSQVIPSFHRPELINFLINEPIKKDAGDTTPKTLDQLDFSDPDDQLRFDLLVQKLRRACLRPLHFGDEHPEFSGGNSAPAFGSPINLGPPYSNASRTQLIAIARWMASGPWDVDNDGDGVADSIWVDLGLPVIRASDGSLIKPLVAPLIEDMDGKVNLNFAGNYAHLLYDHLGATASAADRFRLISRGNGFGPAEINPRHLFAGHNALQAPAAPLNTTYGKLLQSRFGAAVGSTMPGAPGLDQSADPLGQLLNPSRRMVHAANAVMGVPLDLFGRGRTDIDTFGNMLVFNQSSGLPTTPAMHDAVNHPYESGTGSAGIGNDNPFTVSEYEAILRRFSPDRSALNDRLLTLLEDALDANPALQRMVTVESRSLRVVEFPGFASAGDFFESKLNMANAGEADRRLREESIKRMMAIELRKGTKLNLNRPVGNGVDDTGVGITGIIDDTVEVSAEPAFPTLPDATVKGALVAQSGVTADYLPVPIGITDFADMRGQELLARNLYALMFALVRNPSGAGELVPNFPYPLIPGTNTVAITSDVAFRNAYVARRLAQWAANAVDFRDTDAIMTRLRYDPDPFDGNGWDQGEAASHTVWGFEPSDLVLSESINVHDRRVKDTVDDDGSGDDAATPEKKGREVTALGDEPDADMDQFRIPQGSSFLEILCTRGPIENIQNYPHFPPELYEFSSGSPRLDLGRVVGTGANRSPVWRVAIGESQGYGSDIDRGRSPRWMADAKKIQDAIDAGDQAAIYADSENAIADWQDKHRHSVAFGVGFDTLHGFGAQTEKLQIDRVVWFAGLDPSTVNLPSDAPSAGMVYYNTIAGDATALPRLSPGQYAVVAPRLETYFGSATTSSAPLYPYRPAAQRAAFSYDSSSSTWAFKYHKLDGSEQTPNYISDDSSNYSINGVLPIIAEAKPPHEVAGAANATKVRIAEWTAYFNDVDPDEQVDFGFNISAPNPGLHYYRAPNAFVNTSGADAYPIRDGYRNYNAATTDKLPDTPFDEVETVADLPAGTDLGAPATKLGRLVEHGRVGGGTYEDVKTAFLQRLADPTRPWNQATNPYITVDWLTLDLTVFSGEQDLDEKVDTNGDGDTTDATDLVDPFTADMDQIAFDSRRKIPSHEKDRVSSVPNGSDPRIELVERSMSMTRQNLLRTVSRQSTSPAYFKFQLNTNINAAGLDTTAGSDTHLSGTAFPATLGFVNREFGVPTNVSSGTSYVGFPSGCHFYMMPWLDRPYASPYELMMVPACPPSRLSMEFDPGTEYVAASGLETRTRFSHLLGFYAGYGVKRAAEVTANPPALAATDTDVLGAGPGFEQIFDMVDTGAAYADAERWFAPTQTRQVAPGDTRDKMFNRVVETLAAPFNHVTKHRVPGKINLNTTPDFLRAAGTSNADSGENPLKPWEEASNPARYNSEFNGDGSVYRSLAWGISTYHELDDSWGIPSATSPQNWFASTQDTPFGYNFKGFIESRAGYAGASGTAPVNLLNPSLNHNFPTRFAGIFGPNAASTIPAVQLWMRREVPGGYGLRRTTDMTLLRPHPDLDARDLGAIAPTDFLLRVEGGSDVVSMPVSATGLFERPEAELHRDERLMSRNPFFRFKNASQLTGMTTHHSNVFLVRMTIGFFRVDAMTGQLSLEYGLETNNTERIRSISVIDRTIPVAYERGREHNSLDTVILQKILE